MFAVNFFSIVTSLMFRLQKCGSFYMDNFRADVNVPKCTPRHRFKTLIPRDSAERVSEGNPISLCYRVSAHVPKSLRIFIIRVLPNIFEFCKKLLYLFLLFILINT